MGTFATGSARFATTRWSLIVAARTDETRRAAFEALGSQYWYPLYAFARRRGQSADDARELTQGFFLALIESEAFTRAAPDRGRFRSWLLGAFKHFLANDWDRVRAQKRGGTAEHVPLDFVSGEARYLREPTDSVTPEDLYLRRWADELVARALSRLGSECERNGRGALFAALKDGLSGRADGHAQVAAQLAMTTGAVKVAAHRLRHRFRALLLDEAADTVEDRTQAEAELKALLTGGGG